MAQEKKMDSTSGFVILLRVLLGLVLAAGVAVGIYFITTAGINSRAAFYAYNEYAQSASTVYLDKELEENSELRNFAAVNQSESKFTQNYEFYIANRALLNQFAPELYFNEQTEGLGELESSIRAYTKAQGDIIRNIEEFLRTKAAGADISALKGQLDNIEAKLLVLASQLNETNRLLVPFVMQNCLGGDVAASLKYNILDAVFRQANLTADVLNGEYSVSEKSMATNDLKDALICFNSEKENSFANQIIEGSPQADFVANYAQLTEFEKEAFFEQIDKVAYADSRSPAVKARLIQISGFLGFGEV